MHANKGFALRISLVHLKKGTIRLLIITVSRVLHRTYVRTYSYLLILGEVLRRLRGSIGVTRKGSSRQLNVLGAMDGYINYK